MPVSIATNWLTTAWDQNVAMYEFTPAVATLEQVALDWLVDILGLPDGTGGGFVTGATVASFTALAAAGCSQTLAGTSRPMVLSLLRL